MKEIQATLIEYLQPAQAGDSLNDAIQKHTAVRKVEVDNQISWRLRRMIDRRVPLTRVIIFLCGPLAEEHFELHQSWACH